MDLDQIVRNIAGTKAGFDQRKFEAQSLRPCIQRTLTFQMELGGSRRVGFLQETVPTDREFAINALPADLQKKLDDEVSTMVRNMKAFPPQQPPPQAPPPARS